MKSQMRMPQRRRPLPPGVKESMAGRSMAPDYGGPGMPPEPGMRGDNSTGYTPAGGPAGPPARLGSLKRLRQMMKRGR